MPTYIPTLEGGAAGSAHAGKSGRAPSIKEGPHGPYQIGSLPFPTQNLESSKRSIISYAYERSLYEGPKHGKHENASRSSAANTFDQKTSGSRGVGRLGVEITSGRRRRIMAILASRPPLNTIKNTFHFWIVFWIDFGTPSWRQERPLMSQNRPGLERERVFHKACKTPTGQLLFKTCPKTDLENGSLWVRHPS